MSFLIRMNGVAMGRSDLEHKDAGMGVRFGRFYPASGYQLVEPVFRLFAEASCETADRTDEAKLAKYYKARDALPLELVDDGGRVIPTNTIHIADFRAEGGPEAIELEVILVKWRDVRSD